MMAESVIEETGVKVESEEQETESLEVLEKKLAECEEREEYERAAEIQKEIERLKKNEL